MEEGEGADDFVHLGVDVAAGSRDNRWRRAVAKVLEWAAAEGCQGESL